MFPPTLRPSSGYFVLALWETTSGSMLRSHHLLGKVCAEWVEHIAYYIVITVLVFNSLAWWRGVDGHGAPSGVIAPVMWLAWASSIPLYCVLVFWFCL